jgi:hypothetical protein
MSWFNSGDRTVPDKLKGKKEEDIIKAFEDAERLAAEKAAADTAKATAEAAVASKDTELSSVRSRLSELESRATRTASTPPAEAKGPTSVLLDEETAFRERLTPLYLQQAQQGSLMAMQLAANDISSDPRKAALLRKYKAEVDARFNTVPIQFRTDPASYKNCFNVVMGEHLDELVQSATKNNGDFFVEDSSNTQRQPVPVKNDKLDDDAKKIAARMGVSEEDYLARRKAMQFVGA